MFSWDARKALQNYQQHGVTFEEASTIFGDPEGLDWEDLNRYIWSGAGKGWDFQLKAVCFWRFTPYGG